MHLLKTFTSKAHNNLHGVYNQDWLCHLWPPFAIKVAKGEKANYGRENTPYIVLRVPLK